MNNNDYPNRDALRYANDIYLDVMRSFIVHNLRQVTGENVKQLIEDVLYDNQIDQFNQMSDEHKDIGLAIDFSYIPHIIKEYWDIFGEKFDGDLVSQNMLWIIRKGRNKCEHRANDLDIEFVLTHLFLISDILKIINRSDKHIEVINLRNELLTSDTNKIIATLSERIEREETEKKQYKSQYLESERQLEKIKKEQSESKERIDELLEIKNQKEKLEKDITKLSKDQKETEDAWNMTEMSLKSKEKQLNDEIKAHDSLKEHVSSLNVQIEATENENNRYKMKLEDEKKSNRKQLEKMSDKYEVLEKEVGDYKASLNEIQKRLHTTSFPVFPSFDTDTSVRILDRRNKDGKYRSSYITNLLELKQPSIIYVESEEKTDAFFTHIAGEKAEFIGRHNGFSSEDEEKELLEKLTNGELIAIVSNATFPTITEQVIIEHFVFCHPIVDLEKFCKQCHPAFISDQNSYLHLIYDTTLLFDAYRQELIQKYPDRDTLKNIYNSVKEHGKTVNLEQLSQGLDMNQTVLETGLSIFEELQFIELIDQEVKLLDSENKQLEDSKIYSEGKELFEKINLESFQIGKESIEKIYEKITNYLSNEKNQVIDEQEHNHSDINNGNQNETTNHNTEENENTEMAYTQNRIQEIMTDEQVNVIRLRSAAGEPLSMLSKEFGLSSTAILGIVNMNIGPDEE